MGKVFKIIHDKQRGALTLVRVFRGELKKGSRLVTTHNTTEVVNKVYEPLADEYREISGVPAGDVAICAGLKVQFDFFILYFCGILIGYMQTNSTSAYSYGRLAHD